MKTSYAALSRSVGLIFGKSHCSSVFGLVIFLCAGNLLAADNGIYFDNDQVLQAGVRATYYFDDNFFREDGREDTASGLQLRPYADYNGRIGRQQFHLVYRGDTAIYDERRDLDDYFDNDVLIRTGLIDRHKLKVTTDWIYLDRHDPRGVERSEDSAVNQDQEVDRWRSPQAYIDIEYGAPTAEGKLRLRGGVLNKTYRNNREDTAFLDHDGWLARGEFIWRWRPKTRLVVDYQVRETSFDESESRSRNAQEHTALFGITWDATSKTSGDIRIGSRRRQLQSSQFEDFSSLTWNAVLTWHRRTYSRVQLETGRDTAESFVQNAGFIDRRTVGVSWQHEWTRKFETDIFFRHIRADFVGNANERKDHTNRTAISARYFLNEHFSILSSWSYADRTSNQDGRDFDRNVITVGIDLAI